MVVDADLRGWAWMGADQDGGMFMDEEFFDSFFEKVVHYFLTRLGDSCWWIAAGGGCRRSSVFICELRDVRLCGALRSAMER